MQHAIFSRGVEFFVDLIGRRSFPAYDYITDYIQEESIASLSDHAHLDTVIRLKLDTGRRGEGAASAVMADCELCLWSRRSRAERTTALCDG